MLGYYLRHYGHFMFNHHGQRLLAVVVLAVLLLLLAVQVGELKPVVHLGDVLGEGLACALALCWLLLLLCARPAGRVTHILFVGTWVYWGYTWLDLLDEFIRYPDSSRLLQNLEAFAAPVAMLVLTYGLLEWLKEQRQINRQLQSREAFHREYRQVDLLTNCYNADYLQHQLTLAHERDAALNLMLIDVDNFRRVNRAEGPHRGDQLLRNLAEALLAQLTGSDCVCRVSGDRFALLLWGLPEALARQTCTHMIARVERQLGLALSVAPVSRRPAETGAALLARASAQLQQRRAVRAQAIA